MSQQQPANNLSKTSGSRKFGFHQNFGICTYVVAYWKVCGINKCQLKAGQSWFLDLSWLIVAAFHIHIPEENHFHRRATMFQYTLPTSVSYDKPFIICYDVTYRVNPPRHLSSSWLHSINEEAKLATTESPEWAGEAKETTMHITTIYTEYSWLFSEWNGRGKNTTET